MSDQKNSNEGIGATTSLQKRLCYLDREIRTLETYLKHAEAQVLLLSLVPEFRDDCDEEGSRFIGKLQDFPARLRLILTDIKNKKARGKRALQSNL